MTKYKLNYSLYCNISDLHSKYIRSFDGGLSVYVLDAYIPESYRISRPFILFSAFPVPNTYLTPIK